MEKTGADRIRRLPAGMHGIPRELVERDQRERLIAAMAEVCAERGYAATSVADVTRRAGVSTASFYKQFADKQGCMLASFEELLGRLVEEAGRVCEGEEDPAMKARAAIRTAAELLGADLPTARLLTVEVLAAGEEGVRLQHVAIEQVASRLKVEWATVAAMVALVARRAIGGEKPAASELEAALPQICGSRLTRFSKISHSASHALQTARYAAMIVETMTKSWTDERLEERFIGIDRRFDAVDRRLDSVDRRIDSLEHRMDDGFREMNGRFDEMNARFDTMNARFDAMQRVMIQFSGILLAALIGLLATQL